MNPHALFEETSLFLAAQILLLALFFHWLPELTRRDIFFAVTTGPAFRQTKEARQILRRFRVEVWIYSLVAIAVVLIGAARRSIAVPLIGDCGQAVGAFIAFRHARTRAMPHSVLPSSQREASLAPRPAATLAWRALQLGPFAILLAAAIYIRMNWARIPARFPIHWGLDGRPNGWSTRSFVGIYGFWLVGFSVCALSALISYATVHWTRQMRAGDPDAANEHRCRRAQLGVQLAVEYVMAVIFSGVPFGAMGPHPEQEPKGVGFFVLGLFAFIFAVFAILIRTGQAGENLAKAGAGSDLPVPGRPIGDRTPDECWKAGIFYVNRNDPALMVEKRFGIGYTLNFGRPAAWLLLAAILAAAAVPIALAIRSTAGHGVLR